MKDAKAALKQFVQRHISWQVITGKVIAVDDETCDIDPADGGTTFHKVRLKPAVNGDDLGTIIYPTYRVSVRTVLQEYRLFKPEGMFEMKEHLLALSLALLPIYWLFWRSPSQPIASHGWR